MTGQHSHNVLILVPQVVLIIGWCAWDVAGRSWLKYHYCSCFFPNMIVNVIVVVIFPNMMIVAVAVIVIVIFPNMMIVAVIIIVIAVVISPIMMIIARRSWLKLRKYQHNALLSSERTGDRLITF